MSVRYRDIWADLQETAARFALRDGRPVWQVLLFEPGLMAIAWFRLSRWLLDAGLRLPARAVAEHARRGTGIQVHPGARIGRRCLLLAGTPILVGEGSVIGDDCTLEPGAMLIGSLDAHPTLGDNVVIEAGAIVAGEVFLGNDVRVHAGAVVTRDVPDGGVAIGVPGRTLPRAQSRPDPDARAIQALAERLYHLEEQQQILAFAVNRQAPLAERWKTREPKAYGPIPAVEDLIDGAGI